MNKKIKIEIKQKKPNSSTHLYINKIKQCKRKAKLKKF